MQAEKALLSFSVIFTLLANTATACPQFFRRVSSPSLDEAEIFQRAYRLAVEKSAEWHAGKDWVPGRKYAEHYDQVEGVLKEFGFEPVTPRGRLLHLGARVHDVVEDTDISLEQLTSVLGPQVGSLAGAVTNADEASTTLENIRRHPDATILKLADRIANMRSYHSSGLSPQHYVEAHAEFKRVLFRPGEADAMWNELDRLVENSEALAKTNKK